MYPVALVLEFIESDLSGVSMQVSPPYLAEKEQSQNVKKMQIIKGELVLRSRKICSEEQGRCCACCVNIYMCEATARRQPFPRMRQGPRGAAREYGVGAGRTKVQACVARLYRSGDRYSTVQLGSEARSTMDRHLRYDLRSLQVDTRKSIIDYGTAPAAVIICRSSHSLRWLSSRSLSC